MTDGGDDWLLVDFDMPEGLVELVSDVLWSVGVAAIEELEGVDGRTTLRTSLGADASVEAAAIAGRFNGVSATPVLFPASAADTWREFVEPTHVVDDIWLVPQWCSPPAGRSILIEPFDTFGMGNHPTTVLTLRGALTETSAADTVLDLGSGSGVLSVALAKLRGCTVEAHDIAPQGRAALAHNAELNGVADRVSWLDSVTPAREQFYDVVMANILAPVLRQLAGDIQSVTRPGGTIVLSGVRAEQVDKVTHHYERCDMVSVDHLDGWAAVILRRR